MCISSIVVVHGIAVKVCCLDVEACNTYLTTFHVNNIKAKDMARSIGIGEGA